MSKVRTSSTRKRPTNDTVPHDSSTQSNVSKREDKGITTLLEQVMQQILTVTYWFDPEPYPEPYSVTIRFSGHRMNTKGRVQQRDRFVQDETIERVIPGSGPISLTTRVHGINPGEWTVTAQVLKPTSSSRTVQKQKNERIPVSSGVIPRLWRQWAPDAEPDKPMETCPMPLAHIPGLLPGIWAAMVVLGMLVALVLQSLVIAHDHLALGSWWVVTLGAIAVGVVTAKGWYIILYWHQHLFNGWCIQGFVIGATATAALLLVVFRIPVGIFLDMTAPGLLIAMAIGRVGCFFAGCCGGPPTASRWGVWSSDQRVGVRRIPTQLLELTLALSLGIGTLLAVLSHGPAKGAFFVAALAAYTLVRQGILHLRAEPRKSKVTGPITALLAAFVLIAAIVFLFQ